MSRSTAGAKSARLRQESAQPGYDAFAELIADGHSIGSATRTLGKSQAWGTKVMARMRADLGVPLHD